MKTKERRISDRKVEEITNKQNHRIYKLYAILLLFLNYQEMTGKEIQVKSDKERATANTN